MLDGKQANAEREHGAAAAVRKKPEVADADESRRQHVQQESAQELVDCQRRSCERNRASGM